MKTTQGVGKEWKRILFKCLEDLKKEEIIKGDIENLTGRLILDINLNQGGITDLDVSIKVKHK
jgi:hypothetical protein